MTIGTPTVVATLSNGSRAVHLDVYVPNSTTNTRVTVRRKVNGFDSGGEPRYFVRGFINATPSSGHVTGYDIDFPQNATTITYIAFADDSGTSATSAATSITGSSGKIDLQADYILADTATPLTSSGGSQYLGVPVQVGALDELKRPARVEVLKPLGRRDPVAISDRRGYPSFDLTVWTMDASARQDLEDILMTFGALTFSPRYPGWMGSEGFAYHLAVQDATERRISHLGIVVERAWVLQCQQIGAPKTPRCTSVPTAW